MTKGIAKRLIAIIAGVLAVFCAVFTFMACGEEDVPSDEEDVPSMDFVSLETCDVVAECGADYGEDVTYFMAICRSIEEMTETFVSNGHVSTYAIQTACAYLEGHPEGKALVVCTFYQGGYSGDFRIQKIEVEGGKLTMYTHRPNLYVNADGLIVSFDVISPVCLVAGVDESLVVGVTELDYVITR